MKKSFIFASVVAVVALLATACNPQVQPPTARFGYDVNDLTVTFTNLSKEATSYVWEFGDGETSNEENPVHVYKEFGDYTVKLTAINAGGQANYSEEISLEKKAISIDGNFADWDALGDKAAMCVADEYAKEDYFYVAKFARDNEFVYFYLEFDDAKDEFDVEGVGIVNDYYVKHVSLWLNFDEATGCDIWWWAAGANVDFLIEGMWSDNFESAAVQQCPAELNGGDNSEWIWDDTGIAGAVSSCNAQDLTNGHKAIEGKIMVALFPIQPQNMVKMGIGALAPDWETYAGRLPQATVDDNGLETQGALVEVPVVE